MEVTTHAGRSRERARRRAALNAAVHARQPGAFEHFYTTHRDRLLRYALSKLASEAVAEELCQEAWLRLIGRLAQGRVPTDGSLFGYLRGIAHNTIMDRYRARQRHARWACQERGNTPDPSLGASPPDEVLHCTRLTACLTRPPNVQPDAWQAFLWHQVDGLSMNDIATRQQTNPRTAATRVFYARKRLRERWERYGWIEPSEGSRQQAA